MAIPLVVLAAGAAIVGFLGMPAWAHLPDFWGEWLHGVVAGIPGAEEHHHDATSGMIALVAGSLAGLGGFAFAWVKYRDKDWHAATELSPLHQLLMDKWRVDELYDAIVVRPMAATARVAANVDRVAVDGLTKLAATFVRSSGWVFTRVQNGAVHAYGAAMAFGMVALTWWVLYPHPHIDAAARGDAVHFVAGSGLGYEYRWDFDSDGQFDTEWSKDQRDVSFSYAPGSMIAGVEIKLLEVAGRNRGPYRMRLGEGESDEFSTRHLGDSWKVKPERSTPPSARYEDGKVYIRPGASSITVDGKRIEQDEVELLPGATFQLGPYAKLRADAVVLTTLAVRNVFGNVAQTRERVVIQPEKVQVTATRGGSGGTGATMAQREGGH